MAALADVARTVGMSSSTVSLVLSNDARVNPDTVQAVRRAIRDLGYVHGRRGRRVGGRNRDKSRRRTNRIALVSPGLPRSHMNSPVYMSVLHGVQSALAAADKVMVLRHLSPGEACPAELFPQKVDGVVLFGRAQDERLVRRLRELPCVQMMGIIEPEGFWDHVSHENSRIGKIAAAHLLTRGHRHVVSVSFTRAAHFAERIAVFRNTIAGAGGTCLELLDTELINDRHAVHQVSTPRLGALVAAILAATPRPTGVFLAADTIVPGFYGELYRRGLRPGNDLDIIACNHEEPLLAHVHPRPATIDIHAERIGQKAVEQLLWRIEHPTDPRVTIALEPALVPSPPAAAAEQGERDEGEWQEFAACGE